MKKTIPALLLVLLLLTGCGGSAPMNNAATESMTQSGSAAGGAFDSYYDAGFDYGFNSAAPDMPKEEPASKLEESTTSNSAAIQSAKMIYTADVTLQTKEYDEAYAALNALVGELGGYFETRELSQGGTYRSMFCVVRVPADQFTPSLTGPGPLPI